MGRGERSQGLAPPGIRKDVRAKQARHIVNKAIPAILASDARARRGAENSELIVDPKPVLPGGKVKTKDDIHHQEDSIYVTRKGQGRRKLKRSGMPTDDIVDEEESGGGKKGRGKTRQRNTSFGNTTPEPSLPLPALGKGRSIRIISSDTLTVARMLASAKSHGKAQNVCILNMASPLRPGGGVLSGATSQEEFLCARTTLLPSLKENFYRLPELGGVWTSDVLVFRSAAPIGETQGELSFNERYWIDVISAGMLRFPELEGEEDEEKRLSGKDRDLVEAKMRAVLRIAARKGVRRVVLGAWGCGAYGNPVADVAREWKNLLNSPSSVAGKGRMESFDGIEHIIFAISNDKMAQAFAQAFGGEITVERGPEHIAEDEGEVEADSGIQELRSKISEMQEQLHKVWNPELRARMQDILNELILQLQQREGALGTRNEDQDQDGEQNSKAVSIDDTDSLVEEVKKQDHYNEAQSPDNQGGVRIDE